MCCRKPRRTRKNPLRSRVLGGPRSDDDAHPETLAAVSSARLKAWGASMIDVARAQAPGSATRKRRARTTGVRAPFLVEPMSR